jgi:hypothetical protein
MFLPGPVSDCDPPTYESYLDGTTGAYVPPHLVYLLKWGLTNILLQSASNLNLPDDLHFLISWDYHHQPPHSVPGKIFIVSHLSMNPKVQAQCNWVLCPGLTEQ